MASRPPEPLGAPTRDAPTTAPAGDWPAQAADAIERAVGSVRDKTTGPVLTAARAMVYGIVVLLLGVVVAVLAAVILVRILVVYLPDDVVGVDHVWVAHLLVGIVFTAFGAVLWSKRNNPAAQ